MNDLYYYSCSYPLGEGSIVLPGNWARITELYTPNNGNAWIIVREKIFEDVRKKDYKEKPSRFKSLFMCDTETEITNFISNNQRVFDLPYEVQICDSEPNIHKGCLIVQNIEPTDSCKSLEEKAHIYWQGENIQQAEYVTTSSIKLLRRLNV